MTVERAATMFAGFDDLDGTAWYHPRRLSLDSQSVNGGIANPAQEVLGVRARRGTELAFPIYAIETSLGAGRVLRAAQTLAEQSGISDDELTLVDESTTMAHVDPLAAEPSKNEFLETVVPFLGNIV